MSSRGATIELESENNRLDNLLFSEGGSRILFSVNKKEKLNFLNFLKDYKNDLPKEVYVKKIGYVSENYLKINIQNKKICSILVDELAHKFNNSISSFF